MFEQTKQEISYTAWEEGGFVVTINGSKIGEAVDDEAEIQKIVEWLKWSLDEIVDTGSHV